MNLIKGSLFILIISAISVACISENIEIEDRVWIHSLNKNKDKYYFTDGEGYVFSSRNNEIHKYSDLDWVIKKNKSLAIDQLGEPKICGSYKMNKKKLITETDKGKKNFKVTFIGDTTLWNKTFTQIKLQVINSNEVYSLFTLKE